MIIFVRIYFLKSPYFVAVAVAQLVRVFDMHVEDRMVNSPSRWTYVTFQLPNAGHSCLYQGFLEMTHVVFLIIHYALNS